MNGVQEEKEWMIDIVLVQWNNKRKKIEINSSMVTMIHLETQCVIE